jgi:hypothetical protein
MPVSRLFRTRAMPRPAALEDLVTVPTHSGPVTRIPPNGLGRFTGPTAMHPHSDNIPPNLF